MKSTVIVKNIRIPIDAPIEECYKLARGRLSLPRECVLSLSLHKRSIDARHRNSSKPEFVYAVCVECKLDAKRLERLKNTSDIEVVTCQPMTIERGSEPLRARPLVVGFGPCGMFAALLLAEQGYRPIVVERGGDISSRTRAVDEFIRTGRLNTETNIQFGAGGAGTFSDGKLVTRINDPHCSYVLERLREFGAPDEITKLAKPHIGTDRLLGVVGNIARRICELGGEIRFDTKLVDIKSSGRLSDLSERIDTAALESNGIRYDIEVGAVILAIGHSARDTFDLVSRRGADMTAKPFSVGVRIEHLQSDIDDALYGEYASMVGTDNKRLLPPGEYQLSWREEQRGLKSDTARGVYSFCMCPGGEVVAAASEEGGVVTNGMSRYARDGRNANAAIAVSVFPEDIGGGWREAIQFQRRLERAAFKAGGGDYRAPVELVGDFLDGRTSGFHEPKRILPTYRGGEYTLCDLTGVLPEFVADMLKKGLPRFGRKLRGFDARDALLTGVETRTSSPVRIIRQDDRTARVAQNLYPCGEGAGYAGGITSAAVDGIYTALALMKRYAPLE